MVWIMCGEQTEQAHSREKLKDFMKLKENMRFRKLLSDLYFWT